MLVAVALLLAGNLALQLHLATPEAEADIGLKDVLKDEVAGILHWALAGLNRLRKRGKFVEPQSSKKVRTEFSTSVSPIREFFADCTEEAEGGYVPKLDLYGVFRRWAKEHNCPLGRMTKIAFGRKVQQLFPHLGDAQRRINGSPVWVYVGIELDDYAKVRYAG